MLSTVVIWAMLGGLSVGFAQLPTNNDPQHQIRFANAEEANARRKTLIRYIWPDGLPTDRQPKVTEDVGEVAFRTHLKGVDPSLVKRLDRLEVTVLGMR